MPGGIRAFVRQGFAVCGWCNPLLFFEQLRKIGEVVVAHPEGGLRDVQALCAGAGSTFDPLAGKNAFLVVVFDFTHLGAQVGAFDQPWVGVSAGKNQFKTGRLHIDNFNPIVNGHQTVVGGDVRLVENDHVVMTASDDAADILQAVSGA